MLPDMYINEIFDSICMRCFIITKVLMLKVFHFNGAKKYSFPTMVSVFIGCNVIADHSHAILYRNGLECYPLNTL